MNCGLTPAAIIFRYWLRQQQQKQQMQMRSQGLRRCAMHARQTRLDLVLHTHCTCALGPNSRWKMPKAGGPHTSWVSSLSTFVQMLSPGCTADLPECLARIFSVKVKACCTCSASRQLPQANLCDPASKVQLIARPVWAAGLPSVVSELAQQVSAEPGSRANARLDNHQGSYTPKLAYGVRKIKLEKDTARQSRVLSLLLWLYQSGLKL